jgi:hypothetical protein
MAEIAARQHRRVLPELAQRAHDPSRKQPRDGEGQHQRADEDQRAPFEAIGQGRVGNVRGHPDRHQPGDPASRRKAVHALHIVQPPPPRYVAAFLGGHALLQMLPVDLLADQLLLDQIPCNDHAALVDDVDYAARGQRVKLQCVLKAIEHRADGQHRPYPAGLILDRAREIEDSMSAPDQDRLSDRGNVIGHRLTEVSSVAGVGTRIVRVLRCPDIDPLEIEQQDVGAAVGQLALDLAQQCIIGAPIGRVEGHDLTEHRQHVFGGADMVIDLRGQQPCLVDRMLGRCGPVAPPLAPERGRHDDRKWNHGRECQSQES